MVSFIYTSSTDNEYSPVCSIKTVGSTKIYKAVSNHNCCQTIDITVRNHAFLLMVPDPVTCYVDSHFTSKQKYIIDDSSSAVIVDWYTSGREVSDCLYYYI